MVLRHPHYSLVAAVLTFAGLVFCPHVDGSVVPYQSKIAPDKTALVADSNVDLRNAEQPVTGSILPITNYIAFAGVSALVFDVTEPNEDARDDECPADLSRGTACSVMAGSPVVLTARMTGPNSSTPLSVWGASSFSAMLTMLLNVGGRHDSGQSPLEAPGAQQDAQMPAISGYPTVRDENPAALALVGCALVTLIGLVASRKRPQRHRLHRA